MYTYEIELIRVLDGDTIDAYIDLGFHVKVKKRVRLSGINAPETRTRDKEEKRRGIASKERLKIILEQCDKIRLVSHGVGKYGRCLGTLYNDEESINDQLIREGHATAYNGGKR
jgi:micrococcal nuclease